MEGHLRNIQSFDSERLDRSTSLSTAERYIYMSRPTRFWFISGVECQRIDENRANEGVSFIKGIARDSCITDAQF